MTTKPPSQNAIGRELGLSSATMTKMRKAGCPMDSVESVRAWRREHLNIAQRKLERRQSTATPGQHLALAQAAMQHAAALVDAGLSLEPVKPALRHALRCVPAALRDDVGLHEAVMRELLAPFLEQVDPDDICDGETMSDADAKFVGAALYQLACGELDLKGGVS